MPGWGSGRWGLDTWGGSTTPLFPPGTNPPQIILRDPDSGFVDVAEDAVLTVSFFDADFNLDTSTTLIEVDGVTVFTGSSGAVAPFVANVTVSAGTYTVQLFKQGGWGFDATVTVRAYIEDTTLIYINQVFDVVEGGTVTWNSPLSPDIGLGLLYPGPGTFDPTQSGSDTSAHVVVGTFTGLSVDDTWSWRTRSNPICYTGLNPLEIESAIQQPLTAVLDLEPVRQVFINNALKVQDTAIANELNKATRVIYQHAFSTELSTVLNPYILRDENALASIVCERQNTLLIDQALTVYKERIRAGFQALFNQGSIPEELLNAFVDYQDSTIYSYRVSLVAIALLLARSIELQG
jgi:hypothetical protein